MFLWRDTMFAENIGFYLGCFIYLFVVGVIVKLL